MFNKYDLDTDESCIAGHIWTKFVTEGLPTEGEIFSQVVSDFKSSIREIVDVILSNDRKQNFQYVQNIWSFYCYLTKYISLCFNNVDILSLN